MKRLFFFAAAALGAGSFWWTSGCLPDPNIDVSLPDGSLPDGAFPSLPKGVGEACTDTANCRPGLACVNGACAPGATSQLGTDCVISGECAAGLFCGPERKCAPAGAGKDGDTCTFDGDCEKGLRCNIVELSTKCQPEGTKDVGGACQLPGECYGGLLCAENQCVPAPPGIPSLVLPTFKGVQCDADAGPLRAYFDVPRGGAKLADFFRLPFPNDIRTKGAAPNLKPDYTDFPVPGTNPILGYDLVATWARFAETSPNINGFSAYPTTTFRFSGEIDFDTLNGADVTNYVDLDANAGAGQKLAHVWSSTSGRSAYVCENSLSFRPPTGGALKPGHTYAVFFTKATKGKGGATIEPSADLTALLAPANPGGELSASWTKYAKLRTWATTNNVRDSILNAAVFTVGEHDKIGKALPAAIAKPAAKPSVSRWVRCGTGPSPCAQAEGDRACPAQASPDFQEWHAIVKLPVFQSGAEPFAKEGGAFDPNAAPRMVDVCAALTVPAAAAGPLPTVIYAHGTGGTFRSHARPNDVGTRLARKGIAVLGIDQVAHGTRRGGATTDASLVFFNFANPPAAQGNVLQGGADQVSLVRLLANDGAAITPTGAGFTIGGTSKVAYWGHSQGATEGAIGMPYVTGVAGVVFSGQGGSLIDSLLTKTSPVNFKGLAPALLSEAPGNVNQAHPVFTLFQNGIDPADPLDHAANMTADPAVDTTLAQATRKHVFVPYGMLDTFSTPITQQTYIAAALLGVAPNAPSAAAAEELYVKPGTAPISGNRTYGGTPFTMATRQYGKPTGDGHFVAFQDATAIKDIDTFLETVLETTNPPTVPAP